MAGFMVGFRPVDSELELLMSMVRFGWSGVGLRPVPAPRRP
jgi:hypothetical protein